MSSLKIGRHSVEITHPEKILFPADGITKAELIAYYQKIAPIMLPHIKNRLLSMHRFPQGIAHEGFFHKNAPDFFPSWIKQVTIEKQAGGEVNYVVCNNAATLVYLANYGCITPHIWLSKIDNVRKPDRLIFDLDPTGKDFNQVRTVALHLKSLLEDELGLPTFVMTTGSRGLHIMIPVKRLYDIDYVHAFAHDVACVMVARYPNLCTVQMSIEKRGTKVFIDYLRNSYAQTTVAPYAVRAKNGAPVAMPIFWLEVLDKSLNPQKYTIKNMFDHLVQVGDAWQEVFKKSYALHNARSALDALSGL